MTEIATKTHADWCNVEWDNGPCDCGGNGGRCEECGAEGPCGFADDGSPLIHTFVASVPGGSVKEGE